MFQTSKLHRSPSYLVRNPYAYCFRIIVPETLRDIVGKREIRISLRTGRLSEAKYKAGLMGGLVRQLFFQIQSNRAAFGRADVESKIQEFLGFVLQETGNLSVLDTGPVAFATGAGIKLKKLFESPEYRYGTYRHPWQFWLPVLGFSQGVALKNSASCMLMISEKLMVSGSWISTIMERAERAAVREET